MSEWKIQLCQAYNNKTDYDQDNAEEYKKTAQIEHGTKNLRGGQHRRGLAQKLRRLARLGENTYRTRQFAGLLADVLEIRVERREHNNATGGKLAGDVIDQRKAIALRHGHV